MSSSSFSDGESSSPAEWSSRPSSPIHQGTYTSLIERLNYKIEHNAKFFSLEFFPPRIAAGAVNLLCRFERMRQGGPLFCSITWHVTRNNAIDCETSSLSISGAALNYCGVDTMLHLACCVYSLEEVNSYLRSARDIGIRNILALRGDCPTHKEDTNCHFRTAADLVKHIRENFGDYFVIAVAGYPLGHPEASSYQEDLHNLKAKVDAGADFIITQLFFEAKHYISFVTDCHNIGINVPIIPGILPIQSYDSLKSIVKLSKLPIPQDLQELLKSIRWNNEAVRNYGIYHATELCRELLNFGAPGLHFYTLNRELASTTILKQLDLWNAGQKLLPWPVPVNHRRVSEDVRPIFWRIRPKSYIYRTRAWDEFPNGRWGNSQSPAFGDMKDYYLFFMKNAFSKGELKNMWGHEVLKIEDVWEIFYCYVTGKENRQGNIVSCTPWNDDELDAETAEIAAKLAELNRRGVMTINSQPNVNGASSTHSVYGWGMPGGYVYQKAYIEFFTCKENVTALRNVLPAFPHVNYHIVNISGQEDYTNCHRHDPIAVTWGVFPGKEIVQPTVVDPVSFKVWKDEAFDLWQEQWAKLYDEGSPSRNLLMEISQTHYLVNLVDNEFPKPNSLWNVLEEMLKCRKETQETN